MNGDPSKDSDHTIDAENMIIDEPDRIFDSVEVTCVVSCVHQHHCILFDICSPVREIVVVFDVQQNY